MTGALAAGLLLALTAAAAPTADEAGIAGAVEAGRFGGAVFLCDKAAREGATLSQRGAELCARAYLGLGDKLARVQSPLQARERWKKAAELDPRLLDDPDYLSRLETGRVPGDPTPVPTPPAPVTPKDVKPAPKDSRPARPPSVPPEEAGGPPETPRPHQPPPSTGPRAERTFGFGLGGGFDGILSGTLAWLHAERLAFELSVGILYPTLDARVRFYGLPEVALTPVIGLGMTTAFGRTTRFGLDVQTYEDLYKLGQTIHVDIGLSLAVWKVDLFAGVAFLTTLDQEHPDRLLFFPQAAAQVLFYFF